ncbi:hypothetical protein BJX76DRAFT_299732 [Aspergillus varians]
MSLLKADADIILNKANIALARSQRLVASWLPAEPLTDQDHEKTDSELQREEDEIFTAVPETLGLGAPLPMKAADGSWNRTELDSNDQLRKQLLGKNYKKVMAEKARQKAAKTGSGLPATTNPVSNGTGNHQSSAGNGAMDDDDDDNDEGRSASIAKKASRKRKVEMHTEPATQTEDESGVLKNENSNGPTEGKTANSQQRPNSKGRKKATSYLDEILAERSKKRKKR